MSDFVPLQAKDELPARPIVVTAVVSLAVAAVAIGAARLLLAADGPLDDAARATTAERAPVEIGQVEQSMIEPTRRGIDLQNAQRRALDRYRWVDRDAGIVAIPIERAMDLAVEGAR